MVETADGHEGDRSEYTDDFDGASVRVFGVRRERFVEFEFAKAPELVVELVMPIVEFERFCEEHQLRRLPGEAELDAEVDRLARVHGVAIVPVVGTPTR